MSRAVWPMPVSVEQIAFVVRRMSPEERRRLVELAPELLRLAEGRDLTGEELWAVDLLWYGAGGEDGGY